METKKAEETEGNENSPAQRVNPVPTYFFKRVPQEVAPDLLGLVLRHQLNGLWLESRIIETEAYLLEERGSHAFLGETPSRRALFMEAGTIYMYYARGGDSFNFSCHGPGNAVLVKAGIPHPPDLRDSEMLQVMHQRNPINGRQREPGKLCSGQTLFCKALGLRVPDWNQKRLIPGTLELSDPEDPPQQIIQTTRLGIPKGRDEHLLLRFLDAGYAGSCTQNPLRSIKNNEIKIITPQRRFSQNL